MIQDNQDIWCGKIIVIIVCSSLLECHGNHECKKAQNPKKRLGQSFKAYNVKAYMPKFLYSYNFSYINGYQ